MKKIVMMSILLGCGSASANERFSTAAELNELLIGKWSCQGYGQFYDLELRESGELKSRVTGGRWEALDNFRWRRIMDNGNDRTQEITVVSETKIKVHGNQTSTCNKN